MNKNEGGTKRVEDEAPIVEVEHKRHKLNAEEVITETTIPSVPGALVLDKSQQDTIKELLRSSNISPAPGKTIRGTPVERART